MKTIEYTTMNKTNWPRGEWDKEPDKRQWLDHNTGKACLIVRNCFGNLCGYVGLQKPHPLFGKTYDEVEVQYDICVHGGLTFSGLCSPDSDESESICHITEPSEDGCVWWLGFDTSHPWDRSPRPGPIHTYFYSKQVYRNFAYVQGECEKLALQLQATGQNPTR